VALADSLCNDETPEQEDTVDSKKSGWLSFWPTKGKAPTKS
jgi:hypothetical protein